MEIKISKSARQCAVCGTEFVHEQELRSLVRLQDQLLQREDYCAACWNADRATGVFSVWSLRFYDAKVAAQEPPEVFSPLRQAFYESAETTDRCRLARAYLAAQLLRRQKVFRFIKESNDPESGLHLVLFSDRIGNTLVEVRDPSLTFAEMESGRTALLQRLNELEGPEPAGVPAENTDGIADHAGTHEC